MASIKLAGDTSGEITISAPAVAGTTTLELPATSSTLATQNALGVRNLIINGDMRIAQRGTSFTGAEYTVDRFRVQNSTDGAYSVTQDTDVPSGQGFVNSLKYTVTTADTSLTTTQNTAIVQEIEGLNTAHLELGTANAKTFTISFWVKSSLTGTFGGALRNQGNTRAYPYTYTISSANTWEKKTITINGDTTGTWNTSTSIGLAVIFSLGCGPDLSDTAGAWYGANKVSATGAVELIGTLNATWQITGVQLEVGDTATPFEHRPYDMELARCQRYYWKNEANNTSDILSGFGEIYNTNNGQVAFHLPVAMRVPYSSYSVEWSNVSATVPSTGNYTVSGIAIASGTYTTVLLNFVSSGMTAGKVPYLRTNATDGFIAISGEL